MKTVKIVEGTIDEKTMYMSWECPITNKEEWAQGEFFLNKKTGKYEHEVNKQKINYIVVSKCKR